VTRIAICSAKGANGVTSFVCALGAVWPVDRAVVVAECDPSGGDLAGRFGLSTRLGMTSLVLQERQQTSVPDYWSHVQKLPGGLDVLIGPTGADSAASLDRELGSSSSDIVGRDTDMLADCGRLVSGAAGQERIVKTSDAVLLLVRPDVAGVAHAHWATKRIGQLMSSGIFVALAGPGAFKTKEVAEELGESVIATVPFDGRAALMACGAPGSSREFARSNLVACARQVVSRLLDPVPGRAGPGAETDEPHVGGRQESPAEIVGCSDSVPYVARQTPPSSDDHRSWHLDGADRGS
jgi:MinD-like ATPase involved in chromosome partitioning or flagellar assembly